MTRANIYIENEFFAEVGGDAYPGGPLWDLLESMNKKVVGKLEKTEEFVKKAISKFVNDPDYLAPRSSGVSNWSYEYMITFPWVTERVFGDPNADRVIRVFVRCPDHYLTRCSFYYVPGPWVPLEEFEEDEDGRYAMSYLRRFIPVILKKVPIEDLKRELERRAA